MLSASDCPLIEWSVCEYYLRCRGRYLCLLSSLTDAALFSFVRPLALCISQSDKVQLQLHNANHQCDLMQVLVGSRGLHGWRALSSVVNFDDMCSDSERLHFLVQSSNECTDSNH